MPRAHLLDLPDEALRRVCLCVYDPVAIDTLDGVLSRLDGDEWVYEDDGAYLPSHRDLASLASTCWRLHRVALPVLRRSFTIQKGRDIEYIWDAPWHSSVRSLVLELDCFRTLWASARTMTSGRRSVWKEAEVIVSLLSRLPNLQHLTIWATSSDYPPLFLAMKELVRTPLPARLLSLALLTGADDEYVNEETYATEPLLPLLRAAHNLTSLRLAANDLLLEHLGVADALDALSARPPGSPPVRLDFEDYLPRCRPFTGISSASSHAVEELYLSSHFQQLRGSHLPDLIADLAQFPDLRILHVPRSTEGKRHLDRSPDVKLVVKIAKALPKLLAIGYGLSREEAVWWGVWRRDALAGAAGPVSGVKCKDGDLKLVARLKEGHMAALKAEADAWKKICDAREGKDGVNDQP